MSVPRIVDVVFGRELPRRRPRRIALALAAGVGLHAGTVLWAVLSAPSLETWSAELATKVHAELTREVVVELPKPPPPEAPRPPEQQQQPATAVTERRHSPRERTARSPAQAGRVLSAGPVDLPGTTFVTGSADTYAGGLTSTSGKSTRAVSGLGGPDNRVAEDRSSPVSIEESNWSCPWPREADAADIDEQAVLIQVVVRADGSAESARSLTDPGHGFGAAARACALASRFVPAHGADGKAVRAESPPIRVHFFR